MMKKLLNANPGDRISVENPSSENIAKFFVEKIGLNPTVEKLLFKRLDQHSATLIRQCVILKDLSQEELDDVNAYIKSLERIEGGWFRNRLRYAQ